MHDIQRLFDAMSNVAHAERGRYQLTLEKLLQKLNDAPEDALVVFGGDNTGAPGDTNSYRGFYSDLSFEPSEKPITVAEFKARCVMANGETFMGYKGGDYVMGDKTPLWVAPYGMCGNAIMDAVLVDGKLVLTTKDLDD